jgi:hypothetical protein
MPNRHKIKFNSLIKIVTASIIFFACSPKYPFTGERPPEINTAVPDYNILYYWAAHPDKKDPSDSIPLPLINEQHSQDADVFFLHPTTFTQKSTTANNAGINDADINRKTDYSTILYQASVFNASCKIYAPRYRQANLSMYFNPDTITTKAAFDLAYSDIKKAFEYYLENNNAGRPIIIAAHSQGTTHARRLLKEFFENKPLKKQLVCAYLVGIPVEKTLYTGIATCSDSTASGCVISWRTVRNGYSNKSYSTTDTSLIVTNPVTWTTQENTIAAEAHSGAILYDFNKIVKHPHQTTLKGNAIFISKPRFKGGVFYFKKNYHIGDFNLFYMDIRQDVARRIKYFQKNNDTLRQLF